MRSSFTRSSALSSPSVKRSKLTNVLRKYQSSPPFDGISRTIESVTTKHLNRFQLTEFFDGRNIIYTFISYPCFTTCLHVHVYFKFSGYLQTNVGIKYGIYLAGGSLCAAGVIFGAVITILFLIQLFKQENRPVDNNCPSNCKITITTNILISILLASKSSSFQRSLIIE